MQRLDATKHRSTKPSAIFWCKGRIILDGLVERTPTATLLASLTSRLRPRPELLAGTVAAELDGESLCQLRGHMRACDLAVILIADHDCRVRGAARRPPLPRPREMTESSYKWHEARWVDKLKRFVDLPQPPETSWKESAAGTRDVDRGCPDRPPLATFPDPIRRRTA